MSKTNCEIRYAIVTGAASGLGRAICLRLARDGWHLAITDVDEAGCRETLKLVTASGGTGEVEKLDVSQPEQWQTLLADLHRRWPKLDMLVNNAGVGCSGRIGTTPLEDWRWLLEINLFGVIHGCHFGLRWLKQNPGRTSLVNISSIAAVLNAPGMATYNVAKAGVLSLSETLAGELTRSNVRVTVACPGFFRTRILECGRFQSPSELEVAERYVATAPLDADQIADRIVRAAYRGKLHVFTPTRARVMWYLRRLSPALWIKLVSIGYARQMSTTEMHSPPKPLAEESPATVN